MSEEWKKRVEEFTDEDWNLVKRMTKDNGSYSYEFIKNKLDKYASNYQKLERWAEKIQQVRDEWSVRYSEAQEEARGEGEDPFTFITSTNISKVQTALNELEEKAKELQNKATSGGRKRTRRKRKRKRRKSRKKKRRKSRKKSRRRRRR